MDFPEAQLRRFRRSSLSRTTQVWDARGTEGGYIYARDEFFKSFSIIRIRLLGECRETLFKWSTKCDLAVSATLPFFLSTSKPLDMGT